MSYVFQPSPQEVLAGFGEAAAQVATAVQAAATLPRLQFRGPLRRLPQWSPWVRPLFPRADVQNAARPKLPLVGPYTPTSTKA